MSDSFVLFRPFCRAAGAGGRERERGKRKAEGPAGEREQKTKRMCKEQEGTQAWALKLNTAGGTLCLQGGGQRSGASFPCATFYDSPAIEEALLLLSCKNPLSLCSL